MKNRSRTVAFLGLCTALALILAYVEILIQPLFPSLPGIKMGLPNVIIVFLLYRRGVGTAVGVSLVRILLVSILFGNVMALWYSLAGAVLSLGVMFLLHRLDWLSPVGVSVAGGVLCLTGFLGLLVLYFRERKQKWCWGGIAIDVATAVIYLPAFLCAASCVHQMLGG